MCRKLARPKSFDPKFVVWRSVLPEPTIFVLLKPWSLPIQKILIAFQWQLYKLASWLTVDIDHLSLIPRERQ